MLVTIAIERGGKKKKLYAHVSCAVIIYHFLLASVKAGELIRIRIRVVQFVARIYESGVSPSTNP